MNLANAVQGLLALAVLLFATLRGGAAEVTVAWDPNSEPDLAGYYVYYGMYPALSVLRTDAGTNTFVVLSGLAEGATYFIYATARNTAGLESLPSKTLIHTAGGTAGTPLADPPVITVHPTSQLVAAGGSAVLSVGAEGSEPLFCQWFKDGAVLRGATNSSLLIENASDLDAGSYHAAVFNLAGNAASAAAEVGVQPLQAPVVITHPIDQAVQTDSPAIFSFTFNGGGPAPLCQWFKDDVLLPGQTSPVLSIKSAGIEHAGVYWAEVSNSAGADATMTATLDVLVTAEKAPPAKGLENGRKFRLSAAAAPLGKVFPPVLDEGTVYLAIAGVPGVIYIIESAREIPGGDWRPIAAIVAPEDGWIGLSAELNHASGETFYRAIPAS